jgi:DNA polymerase-1
MTKHVLLIDGNSIAHANHNGMTLTVGGMQVQAIFGFLKSLRLLCETYPRAKPIVLWDGRAEFRFAVHEEYKGNREALDAKAAEHKAAFRRQTPILEKMLETLGVMQVRSPLLEADDLAAHLCRALVGKQITLVSGDRDWIQLVDDNTTWFDPIRNRKVTPENFLDFTGYHTIDAYVHGKCLQGDVSDNVDGIAGLGEKGAAVFLAKWQSVHKFFAAVDAGTHTLAKRGKSAKSLHPEQILASPEGRALFDRNLRLMDLRCARMPEPGECITNPGKPNPEAFGLFCKKLAFASILREMDSFLRTLNVPLPLPKAA